MAVQALTRQWRAAPSKRSQIAVSELDPVFGEVLLLREVEDLSYEEIAGVVGARSYSEARYTRPCEAAAATDGVSLMACEKYEADFRPGSMAS